MLVNTFSVYPHRNYWVVKNVNFCDFLQFSKSWNDLILRPMVYRSYWAYKSFDCCFCQCVRGLLRCTRLFFQIFLPLFPKMQLKLDIFHNFVGWPGPIWSSISKPWLPWQPFIWQIYNFTHELLSQGTFIAQSMKEFHDGAYSSQ